jgi:hypothetical protein
MIQLATDPNARTWRAAAAEAKDNPLAPRRTRNGHAWPFIARHVERPSAPQDTRQTPKNDNGS